MDLRIKIPEKSINKAFKKEKVSRTDFENFKTQLQIIFNKIDDNESEEHLKNLVIQFFKNTFYKNNEVNTKGRTDLAIYNGIDNKSTVGVIFETKKPLNKADMITTDDINKKALHEIILYYLQERIEHENNEIKNIVITNVNEWFVFDAIDFERVFYNKGTCSLVKEYKKWKSGQKTSKNTDLFYSEITQKYIKENNYEIECTYVNFKDFENIDKIPENKLINLYKLFSPEHLLKLPHANDSNSLDTGFYNELLYIIGLEETKINNKKIIKRKEEANRNPASLIENTINILQTENRLKHINDIENRYGTKPDEQIVNVALELNIMWVNRILFLKLLEAQLIQYHNNNDSFKFLISKNIADFEQLNELFFEVLAKKPDARNNSIADKYKNIPYLNSSLFEISKLEDETIRINSLKSRLKINKSPKSILTTGNEYTILEYILKFLDAYDFTSEGSGKIQEENKNLINASVLGLIFEKLNGYKDGSYFTPGYITMYMNRENIRKTVIQKFKEAGYKLSEGYDFTESWIELKDKIENRKQANEIINSIKICDPAVGSGHFLVSALNEIIAIKSELGILEYRNGIRVKNYKIEVINDELIISDKETEDIFEYTLNQKCNTIDYKQDLQETIFHEKQTIIENCLFGVDINPNSVNICRLRMWIELLKHAYYHPVETHGHTSLQLQTLPNIDINIKQGNSLVGRFALNGNGITNGQVQKMKLATRKYKTQVILYKSTNDKTVKQKAENEIKEIKQQFAQNINPTDKDYILLQQKKAKLGEMPMFFSEADKEKWKLETEKLSKEVIELEKKYETKLQTLYGNAFEWRFEFPEVLDENGNFIGFDLVIGNPPYISGRDFRNEQNAVKHYFNSMYKTAEYQLDLYQLFIEKAYEIAKKNGGISYIIPNTWLANHKTKKIRNFILDNLSLFEIVYSREKVFQEADVDVIVFAGIKQKKDNKLNIKQITNKNIVNNHSIDFYSFKKNENQVFDIFVNKIEKNIISKIEQKHQKIKDLFIVNRGIHPYRKDGYGISKYTNGFQTEKDYKNRSYHSKEKVDDTYKVELKGRHIFPYYITVSDEFVSYGKWLAEPRDKSFFTGDRIYLRKIVGDKGLIATIISKKNNYIADQSIYIAKPINDISLEFIVAQLNSKLLGYYFRLKNNEFDRLFPQIKVDEFKNLPIITKESQEKTEIEKIVLQINELKNNDIKADIQKHTEKIDNLIYKMYKLSDEEIKHIESNYIMK